MSFMPPVRFEFVGLPESTIYGRKATLVNDKGGRYELSGTELTLIAKKDFRRICTTVRPPALTDAIKPSNVKGIRPGRKWAQMESTTSVRPTRKVRHGTENRSDFFLAAGLFPGGQKNRI